MKKEIDIKSGWSFEDIAIFKKELAKDRKNTQGDYGFSDIEVDYILAF